jgi:hypothetical protein
MTLTSHPLWTAGVQAKRRQMDLTASYMPHMHLRRIHATTHTTTHAFHPLIMHSVAACQPNRALVLSLPQLGRKKRISAHAKRTARQEQGKPCQGVQTVTHWFTVVRTASNSAGSTHGMNQHRAAYVCGWVFS